MRVAFNVNENVRVRLNEHGREIFRRYYDGMLEPTVDADGRSTFQLWRLMAIYGPHLGFTSPPPFETTIEFDAAVRVRGLRRLTPRT